MMAKTTPKSDRMPTRAPGYRVGDTHPNHALARYLDKHRDQLVAALPAHLTPERMMRLASTAIGTSPKLRQCDSESIIAAVVTASQLGLEIGIGGQAFLVPYRDSNGNYHAQLVPGWQGLLDLVSRSGKATVSTGAVYRGDQLDFELGSAPYLRHKPTGDRSDPEALTAVYAIGHIKGAEHPIIECWPMDQVWAHRDRSNRQGSEHYSFRFPEMYARKIVLLQVVKYLPKSVQLVQAMDMAAADDGIAIRGEFSVDGSATDETEAEPGGALAMLLDALEEADTAEELDYIRSQIGELPSGQRKHALAALSARAAALDLHAVEG